MDIRIRAAREHNLQAIDVAFGDGLTVVTGVSGSGKTSLVFDTLYHEARRRFLEVFALGSRGLRLSPAQVDGITGLGPAVAVGQNLLNRNPLSTLATASGLHPFLRLLYAHFGVRHCRRCGTPLAVLIGIPPADALAAGQMLGERAVATEIPAYQALAEAIRTGAFRDPRSPVILAYALCGFAHVASLAIFVGGIAALVPERRRDLAAVGPRALLAATFACLMTGAVAGVFFHDAGMILAAGQ